MKYYVIAYNPKERSEEETGDRFVYADTALDALNKVEELRPYVEIPEEDIRIYKRAKLKIEDNVRL